MPSSTLIDNQLAALTLLSLRRQWIECAALYWPGDVLGGGLYRRRGSARVTGPWSSWPLTGSSECETGPRGRNTPWMRMSLEASLWEIRLIGCLCLFRLWHMKGWGRKTSKKGRNLRFTECMNWLSHLRLTPFERDRNIHKTLMLLSKEIAQSVRVYTFSTVML